MTTITIEPFKSVTCLNDPNLKLSIEKRRVWALVALGFDSNEIATLTKTNEQTVRRHLHNLYKLFKIKIGNKRVKIAALYWEQYGDPEGARGQLECLNDS